MANGIGDNWIETRAEGPNLASWKVVQAGKVIHSDELHGDDDPSAFRAYRAGLEWAEAHCPGISFHWRHQTHRTTQREQVPSQGSDASVGD